MLTAREGSIGDSRAGGDVSRSYGNRRTMVRLRAGAIDEGHLRASTPIELMNNKRGGVDCNEDSAKSIIFRSPLT